MGETIIAFTPAEEKEVRRRLENLSRALRLVPGGGKIEEDYWSFIYHNVRGALTSGWSNLPMRDYCWKGLGVEMKLLQRKRPIKEQGRRIMHPAATRTISFDPLAEAEICKTQILTQFSEQIAQFHQRVVNDYPSVEPDIRWGVFLWSPSLDEFLYFEERMQEPNPAAYRAEFVDRLHRGKPTRSLWIYERDTGVKRFSVTMPSKGAKVQPYFDVPRVGEGSHIFRVPLDEREPIWLRGSTARMIRETAQDTDLDALIIKALQEGSEGQP